MRSILYTYIWESLRKKNTHSNRKKVNMRKHFAWNPRLFLGTHGFLFGTHDLFLRTHDFFLGTHDFLPTTHDFLPTTHDVLPTTFYPRPTTFYPRPTTVTLVQALTVDMSLLTHMFRHRQSFPLYNVKE